MMKKNNKSQQDEMMNYLSNYLEDSRLNVWHLAILTAILNLGFRQGQRYRINVSRSKIMMLSHINTIPTYHKYFKQIQDFGYIKYIPSYNPGYKSEVVLEENRLTCK